MSQENVELARRAYTAFQAGDFDEWVSYFDPEIEFNSSEMEGPFHGHEGMRDGRRAGWRHFPTGTRPSWRCVILKTEC